MRHFRPDDIISAPSPTSHGTQVSPASCCRDAPSRCACFSISAPSPSSHGTQVSPASCRSGDPLRCASFSISAQSPAFHGNQISLATCRRDAPLRATSASILCAISDLPLHPDFSRLMSSRCSFENHFRAPRLSAPFPTYHGIQISPAPRRQRDPWG